MTMLTLFEAQINHVKMLFGSTESRVKIFFFLVKILQYLQVTEMHAAGS